MVYFTIEVSVWTKVYVKVKVKSQIYYSLSHGIKNKVLTTFTTGKVESCYCFKTAPQLVNMLVLGTK